MIVDKPQKAVVLLEHVERKETPGLKLIILMEPFEEALKDRGQECGVVIKSMQDVEVRVCFWAVSWATASWPLSQSFWLSAHLMTLGWMSEAIRMFHVPGFKQGRLPGGWCWVVDLVPAGILFGMGSAGWCS